MFSISLEQVTKTFKGQEKPALEKLSTVLEPGKIIGLVGPDGAGKTTLMRLLTTLLLPTSGTISINGCDTRKYQEKILDLIGYMPQKFGLYEELTVQENLELYANIKSLPKEEIPALFEKLLRFTQLAPFIKRQAGKLSGGMKQKLGLACALMGQPSVLLLDEPGVGVDPISRQELWKMVKEVVSKDRIVLWSTAYLDEAEKCDKVLLLNEGSLLYEGCPKQLSQNLEGRVFLMTPPREKRREIFYKILQYPFLVDCLIQGDQLRLVFSEERPFFEEGFLSGDLEGFEKTLIPCVPRFEDAFMDILRKKRQEPLPTTSLIAQEMRPKETFSVQPIIADTLTKYYGDFAATSDINFRVKQGEIFGLLGPNGAGKSTTFKMLCGLLPPSTGKTFVLGEQFFKSGVRLRQRIGYMAQKFSLYGDLSVQQNLNFFAGIYGLDPKCQKHKVQEMIEIFELESMVNTNAHNLPLGFKQRLALACSVMHEPDILFLDEPTSGVDPLTRREFWLHINQMVLKGMTILVTTHFMDEAENCDRIALIYKGKNVAMGTPNELRDLSRSLDNPHPTLEDTFIELGKQIDEGREIIYLKEGKES